MVPVPPSLVEAAAPGAIAGAAPAGSGVPGNGDASQALRDASNRVVSEHTGRAPAGRFAAGGTPWNKGRTLAAPAAAQAVDPAPGPVPLPPGPEPGPPDVPALSVADIREMVEYGFDAVDETLRSHLEAGWLRVTGDKDFADEQGEAHAASPKQRQAISLFAGIVAAKYQNSLVYLPEFCLAVSVSGYTAAWMLAFAKLRKAAQLKATSQPASGAGDQKAAA